MQWHERSAMMSRQKRTPKLTQTRLPLGVIIRSRRQLKRRLTKRRMGKEKVWVTMVFHGRYAGPAQIRKSWKGLAGVYRIRSAGRISVPNTVRTSMGEIGDGTGRGHQVTTEGEGTVIRRRKTEQKTDVDITDTNIDPDLGRRREIGDRDPTDTEVEVTVASHRGRVILEDIWTTMQNV